MADGTPEHITVVCTCGRKLKAPANAVGRKARCKGCGATMTIEAVPIGSAAEPVPACAATRGAAPRPAMKKPAPPPPADDDPLSALYDLAAEEKKATTIDDSPRCPQCVSPLGPNAIICTNCGFNVKTGKALQTAKVADAPKKSWFGGSKKKASTPSGKQVDDAMAPQGSFMLGLVGCAIGGLIGGAIWFMISWFTGYELGFIALLVGAATGLGMQIGQKGYSTLGGAVAAVVAFLAIILAKAAVVIAVVIPFMEAETSLMDGDYDEGVVDMMIEREYAARNLDSEETSLEEDEAIIEAVDKKLSKMSKTEMDGLIAQANEQQLKDELADYMIYETLETMKVDPLEANDAQIAIAEKTTTDKIEKMTVAERQAELKRLEAKEEAEYAAAEAAEDAEAEADAAAAGDADSDEAGSDDEGGGGAVALAGMALLLYIFFGGWKSILFLVLAVSLAYKTASGGVSG